MASSQQQPLSRDIVLSLPPARKTPKTQKQKRSVEACPNFLFRAVRSDDDGLIQRGLSNMSLKNRYKRFFSAVNQLPGPLLEHLTHIDHLHHEAVGALDISTDPPNPAAIARYIREKPGSESAEFAVAVVDSYQGRGLARILLATLLIIAHRRGIKRFWCQVQFQNRAMRRLGARFGAIEKLVPEQGLFLEITTVQQGRCDGEPVGIWHVAETIADNVT